MCWFTFDNADKNLKNKNLTYNVSQKHLKGKYKFYLKECNETNRTKTVYLIHEDYYKDFIKSEQDNKSKIKYVNDLEVTKDLLVSDPCYVCDDVVKMKSEDIVI